MTGYGEGGRIALRTMSTGFYLFFALSGFLVAAPFVTAFVEGRPRPRLLPYFRNRALRLVPAAWLLFAFVLLRHGTRRDGASFCRCSRSRTTTWTTRSRRSSARRGRCGWT